MRVPSAAGVLACALLLTLAAMDVSARPGGGNSYSGRSSSSGSSSGGSSSSGSGSSTSDSSSTYSSRGTPINPIHASLGKKIGRASCRERV